MIRFFYASILVFLTLFTNLNAKDNPKVVIIFDASGSMWGQIDGKPKIEIARDALKNVLKDWNKNVEIGLTVYGHRQKGDCNDIESVIPVGRVDKKRFISTVTSIRPKGKTPISRSLRKVADELKYTEEKATIILISDGKETCDPDPCGVAKELKQEGIDFITHVIGFNVDKNTDKQLECIAKATGGEYFSAKNASALNKAIKKVVKKVEKKPVDTTLVPVVRYDMSPNGLNISDIELIVTQNSTTLYSGKDEAPKVKAKVGSVNVKAKYLRASIEQNMEQNFTIKAGNKNVLKLLLKSGEATIDASEQEGGSKVKASIHIYPLINDKPKIDDEIAWCVSTKSKACIRVLPIGDYMLTATYSSMKTKKSFSIKDKEKKKIHVYFKQTGKVEITGSEKEGGKLVSLYGYIYPRDENGEKSGSNVGQVNNRNAKEPSIHKIPVGKYVMEVKYNRFKKVVPFEIKAGKTTKIHVVMGQTGKVEITGSEKEGGKLVSLYGYIYPRDENGEKSGSNVGQVNNRNAKEPSIHKIPVGKYVMEVKYNRFKKVVPFEIKAGKTTKIHVVFAPFHVNVKGITPCAKIHFEVITSDGETVFEKNAPAFKGVDFVVSKGKYTIESSVKDKKINTKIEIGKGQSSVTVNFGGDEALTKIEGVWKTTEGKATIALDGNKVHGYYDNDNGELLGEMTYPKRFEGYWIEDKSNEKCSTAKNGRYYWGKIVWKFDDKMCSFKGSWSYCNKTPNRSWRGSYIRPLNENDRHKLLIKDDASKNSKVESNADAPSNTTKKESDTNHYYWG